ncbi:MAG: PorV/PorQ family protein [Candidatus Krumholzibacteriota bacterium]|nr:PorV/PorQ family protein [Candidatus Krumholzibacteriota bacterium]
MRVIRIALSAALLIAIFPLSVMADGGAGVGAADFLEIPVGARDMALAGATGALPGDAASILRNPALLATGGGTQLQLGHCEWYQDLRHESAMLALDLPAGAGRLGVHLRYLHMDPLPALDADLQSIGEAEVYDLAAGLTWATRLARRWDLGLSVHGIRQELAGLDGRGWALDLGAGLVAAGSYWSVSARNLAGCVDFDDSAFEVERMICLGVARYLPRLGSTFTLEYRQPRYWGGSLRGGVEYLVGGLLVLRAGYAQALEDTGGESGQPSFGAGLRLGRMGLDYSYQASDRLGEVHLLSLNLLGGTSALAPYRYFRPGP